MTGHLATTVSDSETRRLLLFDGYCGFCTRSARWIAERADGGRMLVIPNQLPGLANRVGLTRDQLDRSVWLVDPRTGQKWAGADAVMRVLDDMGGVWPTIGRVGRLPGVVGLLEVGYQWVADHRSALGRWWADQPMCETPARPCDALR